MSNVHKWEFNDHDGDLIDVLYYHHSCIPAHAPAHVSLDYPCPESQDAPVYCSGCSERIEEIPLTDDGVREYNAQRITRLKRTIHNSHHNYRDRMK